MPRVIVHPSSRHCRHATALMAIESRLAPGTDRTTRGRRGSVHWAVGGGPLHGCRGVCDR